MREISLENLTLGDDHTNNITSRIQQMRFARLETHLKALIKKLRNRKQIETQRLHKSNPLNVTLSLTCTTPSEITLPRPLPPNVMYIFSFTGVRLENHFLSPVMCQEHPESINQMFSKPPACSQKQERQ
jgi:hypothetical protein